MQLEFFGAAGEVTGSCHILRVAGRQLLLDCGMIQGDRDAPERNRGPFPFDATAIDAVVLSHAHIDHCGRLPLLAFRPEELNRDGVVYQPTELAIGVFGVRVGLSPK